MIDEGFPVVLLVEDSSDHELGTARAVELRTSAKTLAARVWPPVLLVSVMHFSLRENAIEGRMRKSLRDLFADLLRTSAKTLEARVWPPVLLFLILHVSLRENAIEGRMRKSLRDLFADLLSHVRNRLAVVRDGVEAINYWLILNEPPSISVGATL